MNNSFVLIALGLVCWTTGALATSCDPVACDIFCENGYKVDANGCEYCDCKPAAVLAAKTCMPPACNLYCKNGYQLDANGCEVCQCQESSSLKSKTNHLEKCSAPDCSYLQCDWGIKLNGDACATCYCKDESTLKSKFARTLNLLATKTKKCDPVACDIYCENGYKVDTNGCEYCDCKPAAVLAAKTCEPVACDIFCENGYKTDANGCEYCDCKPKACEPVACMIYCENGYKKDANGCDYCECNANPVAQFNAVEATTAKSDCGPFCMIYCEYGYKTGSDGCQMCECKDATSCQTQREKALSSGLLGTYAPQCDDDGNYISLQTFENSYACVTSDGQLATDWMDASVGKSFDCTCSIKAKEAKGDSTKLGVYVPQCDAKTGKFEKKQCNGSTGYCWCVDTSTGVRDWTVIAGPGQPLICYPVA